MKVIRGYHFTGKKLRDGRPIPKIGVWLKHDGPVVPCSSGLHCSEQPFDALQYAPGNWLHQSELRGNLKPHGDPIDKWAGSERRYIASLDCEWLLRYFARQRALSRIHLWDAPGIVYDYLITGDESLRAAAWAAASWAAAWAAARQDFNALVVQAFKEEAQQQ